MDNPVFPSKVDAWVVLAMGSAIAVVVVIGLSLQGRAPAAASVALVAAAAMAGLILAFSIPCRYTLERDALAIRAGLFRQRIAYRDIVHVETSSNPRSAPALSLARVKITCGDRYQLVSPRDRLRFIAALRQRVAAARA